MRREGNRVEFVKKRLMTNKYKIYITVIQESILNKNSIIAEWFEKKNIAANSKNRSKLLQGKK